MEHKLYAEVFAYINGHHRRGLLFHRLFARPIPQHPHTIFHSPGTYLESGGIDLHYAR